VATPAPSTRASATKDWEVDDPAEKSIEEVRAIRDDIDGRVTELLRKVTSEPAGATSR
jgi:arsenate reductase (thioredoxin)